MTKTTGLAIMAWACAQILGGCVADVDPGLEAEPIESPLIGGRAIKNSEYRSLIWWQYDAKDGFRAGCSGVKVASNQFLTAFHCVATDQKGRLVPGKPRLRVGQPVFVTNKRRFSDLPLSSPLPRTARVAAVSFPNVVKRICGRVCKVDDFLDAGGPDLALVRLDRTLKGVERAQIRSAKVANQARVTMTGYGCEKRTGGPQPDPRRAKLQRSPTVGLAVGETVTQALSDASIFVAGPGLPPQEPLRGKAGGCEGDSGAALYFDRRPREVASILSFFITNPQTRKPLVTGFSRLHRGTQAHTWLRRQLPKSSFAQ